MKLIDADVFAKKAYDVAYPIIHGRNDHERGLTLLGLAQLLDEMPTVDAILVDFITEFKEDYCNVESGKCDIGIANALVELMLCWEDEQEGIEWRNDHERIPSKQQPVDAIPISWIENIITEIGNDSPFRPAIEWLLLTYKMEKED